MKSKNKGLNKKEYFTDILNYLNEFYRWCNIQTVAIR